MPSGVSKRPREVVKSPLPALIRPQSTITRQSWKHMSYNGHLQLWDSFESDVRATFEQTPWINLTAIIEHRPAGTPGQANTVNEQISCGGEGGIEGPIQANIGHPMSAACLAAGMDLQFGDYKATLDRRTGNEIPDIAIMSRNGEGRSLGEVKSPWPTLQPLSDAVDDDSKLRKLVAQIARYMKLAGLKYGFLSTYNETIFLKQERQNNRWILRYSRPIPWDAEFKDSELGRRPQVTLRECFWHFLNLIDHGHRARNIMPMASWVS